MNEIAKSLGEMNLQERADLMAAVADVLQTTAEEAEEDGDTEHGASVHYVTAELDGGPVIAQARITILPGDDEASLAARLLTFEHQLLPAVLKLMAEQRLDLIAPNRVALDGKLLDQPLQLRECQLVDAG